MTKTTNPTARAAWKLLKRATNAARGRQIWLEESGWGRTDQEDQQHQPKGGT